MGGANEVCNSGIARATGRPPMAPPSLPHSAAPPSNRDLLTSARGRTSFLFLAKQCKKTLSWRKIDLLACVLAWHGLFFPTG